MGTEKYTVITRESLRQRRLKSDWDVYRCYWSKYLSTGRFLNALTFTCLLNWITWLFTDTCQFCACEGYKINSQIKQATSAILLTIIFASRLVSDLNEFTSVCFACYFGGMSSGRGACGGKLFIKPKAIKGHVFARRICAGTVCLLSDEIFIF